MIPAECAARGCNLQQLEDAAKWATIIRHNDAERSFSYLDLARGDTNPILHWIDGLHNNVIEGEWREAPLEITAPPLMLP